MIVFPTNADVETARNRNKLLDNPYSATSWFNDFPEESLSCFFPFFERNHLVRGNNTSVPTTTQMIPTGKKEKKDKGSNPALVNVF